jgi:hypothetical protein
LRPLLFVAGILFAPLALATTLLRSDLPTLSRSSDVVVQGVVVKVESRWNGDKTRIVTDVTIDVSEAVKGAAQKTVVLTQPGGVVGDVGQTVAGTAPFAEGQEVVVFLQSRPSKRFHLSGMAQGKYLVQRSSDGKAAFAVPTAADARLLDPVTRAQVAPQTQSLKLEDLKAEVKRTLGAPVDGPSKVLKTTP